jgi:hypothetical protein
MEAVLRFTTFTTGFVTAGPKCYCGNRDWFPKGTDLWVCSYCTRSRKATHVGIILKGPECYCGNTEWIVAKESYRCSYCDRKR